MLTGNRAMPAREEGMPKGDHLVRAAVPVAENSVIAEAANNRIGDDQVLRM